MKKVIVLIVVVINLFLLIGCGRTIDYGTITEKRFEHAHKVYLPMIIHVNRQTRIIPRWINHPNKWFILVQNESGCDWWEVSEEYYNSLEVGDDVDRRENRGS